MGRQTLRSVCRGVRGGERRAALFSRSATRWLLLGCVVAACELGCEFAPDLPGQRQADAGESLVQFTPSALELRAVARAQTLGAGRPLLFQGTLGSAHLAQIARGMLSQALTDRWVPAATWPAPLGWSLQPLEALPVGVYSLATASDGLLEEFAVDGAPGGLGLMWPRGGSVLSAPDLVLCHSDPERPLSSEPELLLLEPGDVEATATRADALLGVSARHCVHVVLEQPFRAPWILLPPSLLGEPVLPAQIAIAERPETTSSATSASCTSEEVAVASVCLLVEDDRLQWRAITHDQLLSVSGDGQALLRTLAPGDRAIQAGLASETDYQFEVRALDDTGRRTSLLIELVTTPPRPRVVINEVLSNPLGPEPAAEWVELVNSGAVAVELGDFDLMDAAEANPLPPFTVLPGQFVVLVSEAYAPSLADAMIPADVALLRLARLGRSGLTNSGELLRLVRRDSMAVLSEFPALAASIAGTSLARATPGSPDQEASSFGLHEGQASPGAPNMLRAGD